jgi:hypothetical protein
MIAGRPARKAGTRRRRGLGGEVLLKGFVDADPC